MSLTTPLLRVLSILLLCGTTGCFWVSSDDIDARWDLDDDGIARPNDCDDDKPGVGVRTWYADADADGFGDPTDATVQCEAVEGAVEDASDCDDSDELIKPGAAERCNGVDDNCDGVADEGLALPTWYTDADSDGYGDLGAPVEACEQPPGSVGNSDDCDDTSDAVHPGATEVCNGIDDNCRDGVDLDDPSVDPLEHQWYRDADQDQYGDPNNAVASCDNPSTFSGEYIDKADDCDDGNADIHPFANEVCEVAGPQVDNDCDGDTNNDPAAALYLVDADGDGFGDPLQQVRACVQPPSTVPVGPITDCNDANACVNPAATEICNGGIDDDCDPFNDDLNCGSGGTGGSGGSGGVCP